MEKTFGKLADGRQARLYTIENGRLRAEVTSYGASLVSLFVDGVDVCLGCDDVSGYECNGSYLGAVVGRNANRTGGAGFELNGERVTLPANEGKNNLHSGPDSWAWRLWDKTAHTCSSLTFAIHSPHGDQGFPGNADVTVTYTIENDGLTIEYRAVSDRDTVFNLTNHAYFNLFGQDQPQRAMDQELMIPGEYFCPDDAENIPTGELRHVEGTPFDFRTFKPIGRDIGMDYEPLILQGGYDHNFVLNSDGTIKLSATLKDTVSGRKMDMYTNQPCVQIYAANCINEDDVPFKNGFAQKKRCAVCLETQHAPDSPNQKGFPSCELDAHEVYDYTTVYKFYN